MNILFIHQNFLGQFRHITAELARSANNKVVSICQAHAPKTQGIDSIVYTPAKPATNSVHPYLESTQLYVLTAKPSKEVFPDKPLIGFFEFFYHTQGADCGFDFEQPLSLDSKLRIRTYNSIHLLSLHTAELGISPTQWQRSVFP